MVINNLNQGDEIIDKFKVNEEITKEIITIPNGQTHTNLNLTADQESNQEIPTTKDNLLQINQKMVVNQEESINFNNQTKNLQISTQINSDIKNDSHKIISPIQEKKLEIKEEENKIFDQSLIENVNNKRFATISHEEKNVKSVYSNKYKSKEIEKNNFNNELKLENTNLNRKEERAQTLHNKIFNKIE